MWQSTLLRRNPTSRQRNERVHNSRQILLRFPQACSLPRHHSGFSSFSSLSSTFPRAIVHFSSLSFTFPRYHRLFLELSSTLPRAIVRTTCPLRISKATSSSMGERIAIFFTLVLAWSRVRTKTIFSFWIKGKGSPCSFVFHQNEFVLVCLVTTLGLFGEKCLLKLCLPKV